MSREVHVRICEGVGVRFPRATRLVIGCEREGDARQVMAVRPKRCARVGLPIPPTQTTLMAFRQPEAPAGSDSGNGPCALLGLTHAGTQSRQGCWVLKRRPASKRLRRTKKSLWRWCHPNGHAPLQSPSQMLGSQLRGHVPYDGLRGNFRLLAEG